MEGMAKIIIILVIRSQLVSAFSVFVSAYPSSQIPNLYPEIPYVPLTQRPVPPVPIPLIPYLFLPYRRIPYLQIPYAPVGYPPGFYGPCPTIIPKLPIFYG